jgi:putative PIN family toxin of toxin-antitoxin system
VRVIIDTNVFISGVFFSGTPYRILGAWQKGKLQMIISQEILEEYKKVAEILLKQFPMVDLGPIIGLVVKEAKIYDSKKLPNNVCEDPDDDKFLACAITSGCKVIVSGDKLLLKVSGYQGIQVLKPRAFMEKYLS